MFDERYGRAVREQKRDSFEVFFDIEPFRNWYEVRVHPHNGGIVVFFQILTERKALEERLQKSETLLRNILDSTTDCIFARTCRAATSCSTPRQRPRSARRPRRCSARTTAPSSPRPMPLP